MECKIDWLQGTIPLPEDPGRVGGAKPLLIALYAVKLLGVTLDPLSIEQLITVGKSFFPYQFSLTLDGLPGSFHWGEKNHHILVRFTGQDCDRLRSEARLLPIALKLGKDISRVDFAADMDVPDSPSSFLAEGYTAHTKARASFSSETGETEYLGSRSSDFFVRVYRYAEPHPRAHLLRAEVEVKGKAAHQAYLMMSTLSEVECVLSVHRRFGWQHPAWKPEQAMPAWKPSRGMDKAGHREMHWLMTQVAPALIRFQREGILDIFEWFEEAVRDKLAQSGQDGSQGEDAD